MISAMCLKMSRACSQSCAQVRYCADFLKHCKAKFLPAQMVYSQNVSCTAVCGNRRLKKSFQRYYSSKSQWNWKLTKFNSVVLDLTASLDSATVHNVFLSNLDGKILFLPILS